MLRCQKIKMLNEEPSVPSNKPLIEINAPLYSFVNYRRPKLAKRAIKLPLWLLFQNSNE